MKLIETKEYLLLIDEEAEIKENTWYENNQILFLSDSKYDEGNNPNDSNPRVTNYNNSIIAYYPLTNEAKELDLPLLPNPFEDEFLKSLDDEPEYERELVLRGYKTAQAKQFSLEDIQKAFEAGVAWHVKPNISELDAYTNLIQSLSTQQLPKEFIISDKFSTFEENIKNGKYKW